MKQSSIVRDAKDIVSDPDSGPHCQIVCVWQEGANSLLEQYKDLASKLPKDSRLEVMVVTKKELMRKFRVIERDVESTTNQINSVCQNISLAVPDKIVFLYIDECWVTVPKKFSAHLTAVSEL